MNISILTNTVILITLSLILSSLAMGLYYLIKDLNQSKRIVKALTIRITLSLLLFIGLLVAFTFGWISPHSLTGQ
jgi:hypothetical protein